VVRNLLATVEERRGFHVTHGSGSGIGRLSALGAGVGDVRDHLGHVPRKETEAVTGRQHHELPDIKAMQIPYSDQHQTSETSNLHLNQLPKANVMSIKADITHSARATQWLPIKPQTPSPTFANFPSFFFTYFLSIWVNHNFSSSCFSSAALLTIPDGSRPNFQLVL